MTEVRFPTEARNFSLLHNVECGSGDHPVFPSNRQRRALSPGVKRPVREADRSPQFRVKIKNNGIKHPLALTSPCRGS
jgi:hypothetical protein